MKTAKLLQKRESIIMVLSGEGIEVYEDQRIPIKAGDVVFIPAGVKHTTLNTSDKEFRFMEFYPYPPVQADFHLVK